MHKFRIPSGASEILSALQSAGYEAYVVGGCVRDSLLEKEPKDWDVCTSALPSQILHTFCDKRVIETGLKHGTVTVVMDDGQYEVTTFRVDGEYSDNRHPDSVRFVSSLKDDLARRDFTMNSMAYNEQYGLVDPFGGYTDLRNGVVMCVGNADDRFNEDALRIMRALRFASVYGFSIAPKTSIAIHKNAPLLKNIAAERIQAELCKLLCGGGVLPVLINYDDVIATIIPELKPCIGFEQNNRFHQHMVYNHIAHAVANYQGEDVTIKVALLLHDIGKPNCYTEDRKGGHFYGHGVVSHDIAEQVLTELRFDNKTKANIKELVLYHDSVIEATPKSVRRWLNKIGEEQFMRLLTIHVADALAHTEGTQANRVWWAAEVTAIAKQIVEEEQCFKLKDLAINGYDVMSILGFPQGKDIGVVLNAVFDEVINGNIPNEREILIKYLIKHFVRM